MDWLVLATFVAVYLGMILGRLPGLALDRTGIARLGVVIGWRQHARVGVPVTVLTLMVAALWLWLRHGALGLS